MKQHTRWLLVALGTLALLVLQVLQQVPVIVADGPIRISDQTRKTRIRMVEPAAIAQVLLRLRR